MYIPDNNWKFINLDAEDHLQKNAENLCDWLFFILFWCTLNFGSSQNKF